MEEASFLPLFFALHPVSLTYFQTSRDDAVTTGNECVSQILFKLARDFFFAFVPAHPLISGYEITEWLENEE